MPAPTNADEMNDSGNSHIRPALCATSTLGADSPISAPIHDIAKPNSNSNRYASTASRKLPRIRQPTSSPHSDMISSAIDDTTRSDVVRPSSTARRDIGSDRNRSMMPFCRSLHSPITVNAELNEMVCTKMPAIRNSR